MFDISALNADWITAAAGCNEAYMCGQAAFKAAMDGENGKMITLVRQDCLEYNCTTGFAELSDVANGEKKVPAEFVNSAGNGVTNAMLDYIRPLVHRQAPVDVGDDGIPVYTRFERKPLEKKLAKYM